MDLKKPLQDLKILLKDSEEGRAKLKQMLEICCSVYPTYEKNAKAMIIIYLTFVDFLGDYESGKIQEAFLKHIQTETHFPTVADIRKEVTKGSMSGMFG